MTNAIVGGAHRRRGRHGHKRVHKSGQKKELKDMKKKTLIRLALAAGVVGARSMRKRGLIMLLSKHKSARKGTRRRHSGHKRVHKRSVHKRVHKRVHKTDAHKRVLKRAHKSSGHKAHRK